MKNNKSQFTAVYKKHGKLYVGWIEEVPGVNTQGKTIKSVKQNLREALGLVLAANREIAKREFEEEFSCHVFKEKILVPTA
ncbi:hypothetical protein A2926_01825 [Candidatus Giovannonibacteria bacterium RIFCSPLOWO2_01_FULL_44_40]|uniref:HicB-like antitoxin of toxin-antitoxin system domain-containing protein n=1 Tax=Candidatus Giovannonibacteria bacterium RIFCSPHIGHO2_01_FULL_45_23 TaxID=1798325 RepID=A0A1F5VJ56_9BACT|nr:MAG: hypothetical protein A2834_01470 [Candidatus Giovannonibacteria bacterium RIFCSPHIGHO2_01_FULL_45_23]OGF76816.1 MAG: hypothetical protein A3C77_00240 [Candidatus Giovannonibacteria bacterium RIFCSPHIGHO2_02_FULL_45_13]OGF79740.1 MAG: hypothetical protein A2926_01825 [Candidatus Giovannonibacteria bacterium RIFCSPLOWO2_01_FULL_44_40]